MSLLEEVMLGAAVETLIQAIVIAKEKAAFFKRTLENLQSTLQSARPKMEQLVKSEQVQSDLCIMFVQQLEKAKVLVDMYSDIKMWKFLKKRKVKKLIQQMDASLQRLLTRDFQIEQLVCLTGIEKDVTETNKKMDHIITLLKGKKISDDSTEPVDADILSSPENSEKDDNQSSDPTFELRWKTRKDKCLHVRFWRSHQE